MSNTTGCLREMEVNKMADFILYLFIVPVIAALGGAIMVFFIWIGYLMLEDMREVRASRAHACSPASCAIAGECLGAVSRATGASSASSG